MRVFEKWSWWSKPILVFSLSFYIYCSLKQIWTYDIKRKKLHLKFIKSLLYSVVQNTSLSNLHSAEICASRLSSANAGWGGLTEQSASYFVVPLLCYQSAHTRALSEIIPCTCHYWTNSFWDQLFHGPKYQVSLTQLLVTQEALISARTTKY